MIKMKKLALGIAGALTLAAGFAWAQGGIQILTSLTGNEIVSNQAGTVSSGFFTSTLRQYVAGPASGQTIAPNTVYAGAYTPLAITDGTEVTCVATTTYISQLYIPATVTITGVALVNATAVAGNVTVGLADSTGAPITSARSASTAASGTAAYQRFAFASAYTATPGTYYLMAQCNNTGYKFRALAVGNTRTQSVTSGTYGTFASFTPATTFTADVGPIAGLY